MTATNVDGDGDVDPALDVGIQLPDGVDTPRAKLVYLCLLTHGCTSADHLASELSMRKLTLYSVLETLVARGLVDSVEDGYVPL